MDYCHSQVRCVCVCVCVCACVNVCVFGRGMLTFIGQEEQYIMHTPRVKTHLVIKAHLKILLHLSHRDTIVGSFGSTQ